MSDAKALWWPPLTRVYDALVEANVRDASADAKKIQVGVRLAAHCTLPVYSWLSLSSLLAHRTLSRSTMKFCCMD